MILTSLNLASEEISKRKTLLVPVPQFGEDAQIMVTEITVAGYIRRNTLQRKILDDKDSVNNQTKTTAMLLCADLISVMVCPETGDFLLKETELEKFYEIANKETLEALLLANNTLNPPQPVATLAEKKSNF